MTPPNPLTVLIADDNGLFARALETLLEAEETIDIVGRVTDGEQAARQAVELAPDVVLMDLSMPRLDGIEATRRIREEAPGTAVVVLTGSADDSDIQRAEEAGAAGYVTKDRILGELIEAIRAAVVAE
jgi:DNA-binding NarL/FixJ family response regulator